jgi:hypothetical protein
VKSLEQAGKLGMDVMDIGGWLTSNLGRSGSESSKGKGDGEKAVG